MVSVGLSVVRVGLPRYIRRSRGFRFFRKTGYCSDEKGGSQELGPVLIEVPGPIVEKHSFLKHQQYSND